MRNEEAEFRRFSGLLDGFALAFLYYGRTFAMRFKFQAKQTSVHSPVIFCRPRSETWRKPMTDLMMPRPVRPSVCYEKEKQEIKQQAEAFEQEYDRLNFHDDQFDIAEAGITVGMAMLGIAALTRRKWLVGFALVFAVVGVASGVSGFLGTGFHLDLIARLLG